MDDIVTPSLYPVFIPNTYNMYNYTYFYNPYAALLSSTECSCGCDISKLIPSRGIKIIPDNAEDSITFENINDGDIIIDFKRTDDKTESQFGSYYKESTFKYIFRSRKNPYTLDPLDITSLVKYTAMFEP